VIAALLAAVALPVVSLTVNETPGVPFGEAWADARAVGVRALSLDWSAVEENEPEEKAGPGEPGEEEENGERYDLTWPRAAAAFYPGEGARVGLVLRAVDTDRDARPEWLRGRPFASCFPEWRAMATAVLNALGETKLSWIAVGNEADVRLDSPAKIADYAAFARRARTFLHGLRPGVPVGTTLTAEGLLGRTAPLRPILDASDAVFANWYLRDGATRPPAAETPRVLNALARVAGTKPLLLTEVGAPSGETAGSSEAAQAEFVSVLLAEAGRRRLPYLNLVWMNDLAPEAADALVARYGVEGEPFRAFLATLGLRRADGSPKPAWERLARALESRK
jgi:hypothetical protein